MYNENTPGHFPPAARLSRAQVTDTTVRSAMHAVICEYWEEAMEDFNKNPSPDHIYHQLRVMHARLYGQGGTGTEPGRKFG